MNPIAFLKEVYAEVSKVSWPSRNYTIQATILVVAVSVLVGAYIGGLDFLFTSLMNKLLLR